MQDLKFKKNNKSELLIYLENHYPELFKDGILDNEYLLEILDVESMTQRERERETYGLSWLGKTEANYFAKQPSTKTLIPLRDKSLNFDDSKNIIIEGDNLEVLKILKSSYFNSVDVIYIDPPYNTGNDFVYHDKFNQTSDEYKQVNGLVDENGIKTTTNQRTDGRFHTNWLNMIYPRLILAKQLLKKDGLIFISIDDNEHARLKVICDEIFGEQNFVSNIVWQKKNSGSGDDSKHLKELNEYILVYAKNINVVKVNHFLRDVNDGSYKLEDEYVARRGKYKLKNLDQGGITWSECLDSEIYINGKYLYAGGVNKEEWLHRKQNHAIKDWCWRWSYSKIIWGLQNGYVVELNNKLYTKQYQYVDNNDQLLERTSPYANLILNDEISGSLGTSELKNLFDDLKVFDHPKPIDLIKFLINLHPNKNALVLDFFAGSGSTGHAVMDLNNIDHGNRQYILVQIPEILENSEFKNIVEITRARIIKAIDKFKYKNDGFRFFQLNSSNILEWDDSESLSDYNQYTLNLDNSLNQIKQDRNIENLIYEICLSTGKKLDEKITLKTEQNQQYYFLESKNTCFFFFAANTQTTYTNELYSIIKNIYINQEDHSQNLVIYFLDSLFLDTETKLNLVVQVESLSPNILMRVI